MRVKKSGLSRVTFLSLEGKDQTRTSLANLCSKFAVNCPQNAESISSRRFYSQETDLLILDTEKSEFFVVSGKQKSPPSWTKGVFQFSKCHKQCYTNRTEATKVKNHLSASCICHILFLQRTYLCSLVTKLFHVASCWRQKEKKEKMPQLGEVKKCNAADYRAKGKLGLFRNFENNDAVSNCWSFHNIYNSCLTGQASLTLEVLHTSWSMNNFPTCAASILPYNKL